MLFRFRIIHILCEKTVEALYFMSVFHRAFLQDCISAGTALS